MKALVAAVLTAVAVMNESVSAQARGTAVLAGQVVDSGGRALQGAQVAVRALTARTDTRGEFRIPGIPAGVHEVSVRHVGYAALMHQTTFLANDTLLQRFVLSRAVPLDTVLTSARKSPISEFDERRARGGGQFITREELEKATGKNLADVLRRVPGLRITRNPKIPTEAYAANSRGAITLLGANPRCYVQVYIDDAAVYSGSSENPDYQRPYNLAALSAPEIEAVEYYPGGASIPAKYNRTGSACGVLLIWTRR